MAVIYIYIIKAYAKLLNIEACYDYSVGIFLQEENFVLSTSIPYFLCSDSYLREEGHLYF